MSPAMIPVFVDVGDLTATGFVSGSFPLWDGVSFEPSSNYLHKSTRTLIVDPGGGGDYTTVKAACDYILTQTRDASNRWLIQLTGRTTEQPLTFPAYTTILGVGGGPSSESIAFIDFSTTVNSGTAVTFEGSGAIFSNISVNYTPAAGFMTGNMTFFYAASTDSVTTSFFSTRVCVNVPTSTYSVTVFDNNPVGFATFLGYFCQFAPGVVAGSGLDYIVNEATAKTDVEFYWSYVRAESLITAGTFAANQCQMQVTTITLTGSAFCSLYGCVYLSAITYSVAAGATLDFANTIRHNLQGTWKAANSAIIPLTVKGASSQVADVFQEQNSSSAIQFALGPTGQIKTNQISTGTFALGNLSGKMPYYNVSGVLVGYGPVYTTIA